MRSHASLLVFPTAASLLTILLAACLAGCGGGNGSSQLTPVPDGNSGPGTARQTSTSYSVAGYVRQADLTGISNVTVTFSTGGTATTNVSGYYTKAGVSAGSCTITPAKSGWAFSPGSKTVNVNANLTGINFIGGNSCTISGQVYVASGAGLYGVTLTFSGGGGTCSTNSLGNYTKTVAAGTYTITPSKAEWVFTPASKSVHANSNQSGINFVAEKMNWVHTWGGPGEDIANGVGISATGDTYTVGYTTGYGAGNYDAVITKYDANGTAQWRKTWGGTDEDAAKKVAVSSDGYIYVTGYTKSFGAGTRDALLLKYNSSGTLQWQRVWGGTEEDEGHDVTVDSSGNIYVTGSTYSQSGAHLLGGSNLFVLKYNAAGALQWQRFWGSESNDSGQAIIASGSNVYVAGDTSFIGAGNTDICVLCYTSSGSVTWRVTWGGTQNDSGRGIGLDSSNNIYVGGMTDSFGAGGTDFCLLKYNSSGVLQWRRTYGWTGTDIAYDLVVDNYNNIYLCGCAYDAGMGNGDADVLKYTTAGNMVYKRGWGNTGGESAAGIAVDSKRFLRIAGVSSEANYRSWFDLETGTATTSGGTTTSGLGTEDTPTLTAGTPAGTQTSPYGTWDSGGGGSDMLTLKYAQ